MPLPRHKKVRTKRIRRKKHFTNQITATVATFMLFAALVGLTAHFLVVRTLINQLWGAERAEQWVAGGERYSPENIGWSALFALVTFGVIVSSSAGILLARDRIQERNAKKPIHTRTNVRKSRRATW